MANITPQQVSVLGTDITMVTPTVTVGDTFPPNCTVVVRNGSGSSINVTVVTPGNDKYGQARPDLVKACAAGAQTHFLINQQDLADPVTGLVTIICSSITTITIGATTN